jgi:hypothetical protein
MSWKTRLTVRLVLSAGLTVLALARSAGAETPPAPQASAAPAHATRGAP